MAESRPDPDALLARVQAEESRAERGKLKIFFGAAPGVGKTYTMLEAGRKVAKEGVDVLVGYLEPHVRPETQALLMGLDVLGRRTIEYRGTRLLEFNLEAALAAHPQLILVDELAHTNAPGVTHTKRWQDVERLRQAGIDVYTTLNVQHLESLNDVVAQITGVIVRETVPDVIFDTADEIELVDLPPDDLIERLREGKVYLPDQASRAIESFFKKGNLIALRELALRRVAERVNAQMQDYRSLHAVARTWPTSERLLVSVSPSPHSARLVRATRRMATTLRAPWLAVYVETAPSARLSQEDADRVGQTLHMAEELGAETATISGTHLVDELLDYARRRNVTKIVVGKPQRPRWQEWLSGSVVYELTRKCGDIDVYVISGDVDEPVKPRQRAAPPPWNPLAYLGALLTVTACTGAGWLMQDRFALANIIMVYLLGVISVAAQFGRGPSILASILGVAAFDFFFVPPTMTFAVSDTQYLLTFAVMLTTGLVISTLTAHVRFQAQSARMREERTAALYAMSRGLVEATTAQALVDLAVKHIAEVFDGEVFLLFPDPSRRGPVTIAPVPSAASLATLTDHDLGVAQWVFDNGERAGRGTDTLPSATSLFVPLRSRGAIVGILGIRPRATVRPLLFSSEQIRLLETFAGQVALAAERIRSAQDAQRAKLQAEAERLRSSLLSAVSHDLRTPLAAIAGASSTLVDDSGLDTNTRHELAESIFEEAERLNRLVVNLLDMTRLDAGALQVRKEWQVVEEVVGVVLNRLSRRLQRYHVVTRLPGDLPLVPFDPLLIQQVLTNLLENAMRCTPEGGEILLSAEVVEKDVQIDVADRGLGLVPGEEEHIFEKFYRSVRSTTGTGVGLGLTICRGIVELHGGRIWARNRPDGGACFSFTLPRGEAPPLVRADGPVAP
ncbi:MAG TPA: sensor histidine kinase KdpD [Pirellulales bacterium]|nr:sensor histidine kinase KdpD [Pirellulales bacterium]